AGAAERMADLRRGRGNRGRADLRIAATALTAGATLVTRNERDFSDLPGLKVANWIDKQA
ncbi:MAG: PIN domain-containing protein, partial [Planctomycetota bacterium]